MTYREVVDLASTEVIGNLPVTHFDGGTGASVTTFLRGDGTWVTPSGTGVASVSGTAGRISSTGGVNPVIDIDAGYVGQSSITTLGTITTGTWSATAIGATKGGTGQTTYTTGDILYASAANTLSKLPVGSNTQVLTLAAGIPSWATPTTGTVTSVSGTTNRITSTGGATPVIDIDAGYVGQSSITTLGTVTTGTWSATNIALNKGGTNAALTASNGGIFYSTATAGAILSGTATVGQLLQSGATAAPTWSTSTYPATNAINTLLYASSANVMAALATANNGILSTDGSGVPSIGNSLSNDYTFTKATSGATTTLTVSNSSNTASSSANIVASVAGGTAADPTHQSVISGVTTWTWGADNSNSDIFAIAASATLGTTDTLRITTTGQVTKPLQSSFLAYINTTITNITGDASTYTIIYDTEVYDRNNDFNLGTSTFTAPVTGLYDFDLEVLLGGGTSISLSFTQIVTTARTYQRGIGLSAGAITSAQGNNSVKANMTAGDTATFTITATDSGGKVDDLSGLSGAILRNWVSGELIA